MARTLALLLVVVVTCYQAYGNPTGKKGGGKGMGKNWADWASASMPMWMDMARDWKAGGGAGPGGWMSGMSGMSGNFMGGFGGKKGRVDGMPSSGMWENWMNKGSKSGGMMGLGGKGKSKGKGKAGKGGGDWKQKARAWFDQWRMNAM